MCVCVCVGAVLYGECRGGCQCMRETDRDDGRKRHRER